MQLGAGNTGTALGGRGSAQSTVVVTGDRALNASRADVNSALVGGVPVTGNWRVFGQRQIGLGTVNLGLLVGVLVDN